MLIACEKPKPADKFYPETCLMPNIAYIYVVYAI